jgi:hypothetical protein
MSRKTTWKRFEAPGGFQYDYPGAAALSDDEAASIAADLARQIRARLAEPERTEDWIALVLRLPEGLQQVLLNQLDRGNLMTGIGQSGWPAQDSIVANMRDRFGGEGQVFPADVTWTVLNDPRQWRENVSQIVDGQEFMLMT